MINKFVFTSPEAMVEFSGEKIKPKWPNSAKIDTLFMTNAAEKPYPLGPHIPI